ncbi:MAG: helix-turn-helix transcriptional regulator [Flavobacteriaceae bacterium]|nr:helix-turn-helix transcriptional regulator [Flavobacteriaceae bacterium]
MLNYEKILERIQELMKTHDINSSVFAKKIGVQRSGVSHILSGRNKPSLEFISKIHFAFNDASIEWLLFGIENSIKNESSPTLSNNDSEDSFNSSNIFSDNIKKEINSNNQSEIDKIILFYKDNTFVEFDSKN